jgi:hypothetical protein
MIFLLLLLFSCSHSTVVQIPEHPAALIDQVLAIRTDGIEKLHPMACFNGVCPVQTDYDLRNDETRGELYQLQFVCHIGGLLYKIDEDRPGFHRHWCEYGLFSKKCHDSYLDIVSDYKFLVDAKTICSSQLTSEGK